MHKFTRGSDLLRDGTGAKMDVRVNGEWWRVHVKNQEVISPRGELPPTVLVAALEEAEQCMADPKRQAELRAHMADAAANQQRSKDALAQRNLARTEGKFRKYCERRLKKTATLERLGPILDEIEEARKKPGARAKGSNPEKVVEPTFRAMASELLDKGTPMDRVRDLLNEAAVGIVQKS